MDLNELRKQVTNTPEQVGIRGEAVVGALLAIALICSLATAFVENPQWTACGAILFLALGIVFGRALDRRDFATPPIRRS
jgi:hypothetical protein